MARVNVEGINMDALHLSDLLGAEITTADPTLLRLDVAPGAVTSLPGKNSASMQATFGLVGRNFTYDSNDQLTGGTAERVGINYIDFQLKNPSVANISIMDFNVDAKLLYDFVLADATQAALSAILAGNDFMQSVDTDGGFGPNYPADLMRGYGGNDQMEGNRGYDTLFGGSGNDTISGGSPEHFDDSPNFLRGEEGDDVLIGGAMFDDTHGNMGSDTVSGGGGGDWVVGGKDNDLLWGDRLNDLPLMSGQPGNDHVYGNMGNDTCHGGAGDDTVLGGQDNDLISGGDGADWLSGDRGSDTITGGAGADIFHTSAQAGLDRITDFSVAQGDRVMVDPGTVYAVSQSGSDTVVDMGGGNQLVLVGVSMNSLSVGWIFGA